MKRLLIGLGALTVVGSSAVAAEDFRPTGSIKQEVRWYGDQEENEKEGLRLTLAEGGIRFTEKFYIDYRVRDFIRYKGDEGSNNKYMRTRLYYDHGKLGDTEITMRQRGGVTSSSSSDSNSYYYTPEFSFKEYFTPGEYLEVTEFKVRPTFEYKDDNNAGMVSKQVGLDFLSEYSLTTPVPGDIELEANIYYKAKHQAEDDTDVELYAYYTLPLGSAAGMDFTFFNELGYEFTVTEGESSFTSENLYNEVALKVSYKVNSSTSVYGGVSGEFTNATDDELSDFKWQPWTYVGWRTKF